MSVGSQDSISASRITEPYPLYPIDLVLGHLDRVKRNPKGWTARCPAHEDRHPSLSITVRPDNSVRLKCFAGCDWLDIAAALGLTASQLYADPNTGYVRQQAHGARVTFAHSDTLEGEVEDYAARVWENEYGEGWRQAFDAAADRLEGMFNLRRRYGHKF